jgi:HSP20 family protein
MSLVRWQPIKELESFRQQMDRLFDDWMTPAKFPVLSNGGEAMLAPAIELQETDAEITLKAQIPGIEPKDLNVEVGENAVLISGEHQQEKKTEEKGIFRSEFQYGRFERTVPLPTSIKTDQVKSEFKHGVLTLTLPKAEEAQRKFVKLDLTKQ